MKKHSSKLLMVLCFLLTACLFASCAPAATSSSAASKPASSAANPSSASEAVIEYPDELRIWAGFSDKYSSLGVPDYNSCWAWQELSKNTGTKITWEYGASGNDGMTNLNLMLAAKNYPDLIVYNWNGIAGGANQYAEDNVIVDLTDMYPTTLKNVYDALENVDSLNRVKASDGKMYYIPEIYDQVGGGVYLGMIIRQDMLDAMGKKAPTTLDEYHTLLTDSKAKYGADFYPMTGMGFTSVSCGIGNLLWAFGTTFDFYLEGDTVTYGPMTEAFQKGMDYIHTLYAEGLIDPDYATQDRNAEKGKIMADKSITTFEFQPSAMMNAMAKTNPTFKLVGITNLKEDAAGKPYTFDGNYISNLQLGDSVAISTNCKDPTKAANFMNYVFSDEGALITNYGKEGTSWNYDSNKQPQFTEELLASHAEAKDVLTVFGATSVFPSVRALNAYWSTLPEVSRQAIALWSDTNDTSKLLPQIVFTEEETAEITDWKADLNTYMSEEYASLVNGKIAISEIPAIQENLKKNMHIEEILKVYQAAYDRYKAL